MTLNQINSMYIYVSDKTLHGRNEHWAEMKIDPDGKMRGDCEDYAITVKRNVDEYKNWNYYYCKIFGEGHCVLSNGQQILDCNYKKPISIEKYSIKYSMTNFKKYNLFQIFSKFTVAFIKNLFKK